MIRYMNLTEVPGYSKGKVKQCFNALGCYKNDLLHRSDMNNICVGSITKNNTLRKCCTTCKYMNKETQGYIENRICCACKHFHWSMGEMGVCDLRKYKSYTDIGEWSDSCSIGKFEYKKD